MSEKGEGMSERIQTLLDGGSFILRATKERLRLACCDCGLVHDFDVTRQGTNFTFTAMKNRRCTAQRRRQIHERTVKRKSGVKE